MRGIRDSLAFICYRAKDTGHTASRLADDLGRELEPGQVFIDHRQIDGGEKWPERLRTELAKSTVLLVLIGESWLAIQDKETHQRCLDRSDDWVRCEIACALENELITVIPVLVEGAPMPTEKALASIAGCATLHQCQWIELNRNRWEHDLQNVVSILVDRHEFKRRPLANLMQSPSDRSPSLLATYRGYLRERHRELVRFFGDPSQRPTIQEIFVELDVVPRFDGNEDADGKPGHLSGMLQSPLRTLLESAVLDAASNLTRGLPLRWILKGEPGAGKSTLVRHLCYDLAMGSDGPIPVYVSLARWVRSKRELLELVEYDVAVWTGRVQATGISEYLSEVAKERGRLWIFLDGMDEVSHREVEMLRDRILGFTRQFEHTALVVTTRPIGFRQLDDSFGIGEIARLDDKQQRQLLDRWLGAELGAATHMRTRLHPSLHGLAGNPLMLTMLALLAKSDRLAFPESRGELYDRVIALLLEETPELGGQAGRPAMTEPDTARELLGDLALYLQEVEVSAESFTRKELVDALRSISRVDPDRRLATSWRGPQDFINELARKSGLLGEYEGSGEGWRFLHRSIREFLVAETLHRVETSAESIARARKIGDDMLPLWGESYAMLCMMTDDPRALLAELATHRPSLALRALPEVVLPLEDALAMLVGIEGWNAEDLWNLLVRRGATPTVEESDDLMLRALSPEHNARIDHASRLLLELVEPSRSIAELAYIAITLERIGRWSDRAGFFERCGRTVEGVPEIAYVEIPPGTFMMGWPDDGSKYEGPQHEVSVQGFKLAETTVTVAQYQRFDPAYKRTCWKDVPLLELADHPAVNVNWWEAYLFCAWAGARLPSEAEWEYACRAGTTTPFSTGEQITTDQANFNGNHVLGTGTNGELRGRTVPAKYFKPNGWGLYQMHGNVWEWCMDQLHQNYVGAPADGRAWVVGGSAHRVVRGGAWDDHPRRLRTTYRRGNEPTSRNHFSGFRPAKDSQS